MVLPIAVRAVPAHRNQTAATLGPTLRAQKIRTCRVQRGRCAEWLPTQPDTGDTGADGGNFGVVLVDLVLVQSGLAEGAGDAAQDGESVAVLAGQLDEACGIPGLGGSWT